MNSLDLEVLEIASQLHVDYNDLLMLKQGKKNPTPELIEACRKVGIDEQGIQEFLVEPFQS
jgi:hypothetical protein